MDVRGYGPVVLPAGVTPKAKHGPRKGVSARYRPSTIGRESAGLGGNFACTSSEARREDKRIERLGRLVREGKLPYAEALRQIRSA